MIKELVISCGAIGYVIILCSILGLAFIIERFITFWRAATPMEEFFTELEGHLRLGKVAEARALCQEEPGMIPEILGIGLENRDEGVDEVKQIMVDEVQIRVLPRLEKNLSLLAVIAKVAPMLGLLGTIWGMILMFNDISQKPQFDITDISRSIFLALGTTLFGLLVAIPVIFFHNYFTARIKSFEGDLYKYLTRFLRLLRRRDEVAGGGPQR